MPKHNKICNQCFRLQEKAASVGLKHIVKIDEKQINGQLF